MAKALPAVAMIAGALALVATGVGAIGGATFAASALGGTGSDAYRRFVESGNQPKHMQGLIAVQRKEVWNVPGFAPGHYVGGEVLRHTVAADGVRGVIVSQWHDRVGQRIKG